MLIFMEMIWLIKKAKSALHLPESDYRIPHIDLKSLSHKCINSKCQSLRNNHIHEKLHDIKPFFSKDILKRKDQILLEM